MVRFNQGDNKSGIRRASPDRCTTAGCSGRSRGSTKATRDALAIEIGFPLPSRRVVALLEEPVALHGGPKALRLDNGPEFVAVAGWAEVRGIALDFIPPGQPAPQRLH